MHQTLQKSLSHAALLLASTSAILLIRPKKSHTSLGFSGAQTKCDTHEGGLMDTMGITMPCLITERINYSMLLSAKVALAVEYNNARCSVRASEPGLIGSTRFHLCWPKKKTLHVSMTLTGSLTGAVSSREQLEQRLREIQSKTRGQRTWRERKNNRK